MIELDKALASFANVVNECYESAFPDLCRYPKFSFSRAMAIIWKQKVYTKIKSNLSDAFVELLKSKRISEINAGKNITKSVYKSNQNFNNWNSESFLMDSMYQSDQVIDLLGKFIQCMVDLSVNELTIHYLGSTKVCLEEPYQEIESIIIKQTMYEKYISIGTFTARLGK